MSAITVLVVPVSGECELREIEPTLDVLKDIVGGWIELVVGRGYEWAAYCDEDGKVKGKAINTRATYLARTLGWYTMDVLCGDVVFVGRPDAEGNDTGATPAVVAAAQLLLPGVQA